MQAKGPGPMPANSTMRKPVSGPLARCAGAWVLEAGDVRVSVTSKIHFLFFHGWFGIVPLWIAERRLGGVDPSSGVLLLAFGAFFGDAGKMRAENAEFHGPSR
jgi:hypothetical protein